MGETLKREFSLSSVDTGLRQPQPDTLLTLDTSSGQPQIIAGANGGAPQATGMPGAGQLQLSIPTPAKPVTRPSFLMATLANLPQALAGGMEPDARGNRDFASGLGGSLRGIQQQQQLQYENALRQQQLTLEQQQVAANAGFRAAEANRANTQADLMQQQFAQGQQQRAEQLRAVAATQAIASDPAALGELLSPYASAVGNLTPDEKGLIGNAQAQVVENLRAGKRDLSPMANAVNTILKNRKAPGSTEAAYITQYVTRYGDTPENRLRAHTNWTAAGLAPKGASNKSYRAYDTSSGFNEIVSGDDLSAHPGQYQGVAAVSAKDLDSYGKNSQVLNDMQRKANDVNNTVSALDGDAKQKTIIANALADSRNTTFSQLVRSGILKGANSDTVNYVQSVLSLRESAMALPKLLTGGSRVNETQLMALLNTLPSVAPNADYARSQMARFQQNIDALRKGNPRVQGVELTGPNVPENGQPLRTKRGRTVYRWPDGAIRDSLGNTYGESDLAGGSRVNTVQPSTAPSTGAAAFMRKHGIQ